MGLEKRKKKRKNIYVLSNLFLVIIMRFHIRRVNTFSTQNQFYSAQTSALRIDHSNINLIYKIEQVAEFMSLNIIFLHRFMLN